MHGLHFVEFCFDLVTNNYFNVASYDWPRLSEVILAKMGKRTTLLQEPVRESQPGGPRKNCAYIQQDILYLRYPDSYCKFSKYAHFQMNLCAIQNESF